MEDATARRLSARSHIIATAVRLIHDDGPAAVTTRRVAELAGVQPPAIYRLFGDKDGLLDAVAEQVMTDVASTKQALVQAASAEGVDPLQDLRAGWQSQVDFGIAHPALFRLLSDPERVARSAAAQRGRQALEARVHRIATSGRLRVAESRAVAMIQAAAIGVIQTLLATAPEQRDPGLPGAMYEAVLTRILTDAPRPSADEPLATAVAFRALAPDLTVLTAAERMLLDDWLARVTDRER